MKYKPLILIIDHELNKYKNTSTQDRHKIIEKNP
jgi:hypothetical protein